MNDLTSAISIQLKAILIRYNYETKVYEHEYDHNRYPDYLIASKSNKETGIFRLCHVIIVFPKNSPNEIRTSCIKISKGLNDISQTETITNDFDIYDPRLINLLEDVLAGYSSLEF